MSSALPTLLRLTIEIISGANGPGPSAADAQARLEPKRDVGLHVGELLLEELGCGERPAELVAVEAILPRRVEAEFGGAERTPLMP
jgi:hypothetical protein